MGHIYRELKEIPIPKDGHLNHHDGYVSVYYKDASGRRQKTAIGKATSETTMQPNDNFRFRHPDLWQLYYGGDACPPEVIHVGLYAIVLAIGYLTGLYPLLIECLGPLYANAIMDYAMFCIDYRTNASYLFEVDMADRMLFSRKVFSDSWFSSLITEKLSSSQLDRFRREWPATFGAKGSGKVWLCIDGSNCDSDVTNADLPGFGLAKSGTEREIVSFIVAVRAEDGCPVTWFPYHGGMPDCKAIDEMIRYLSALNISVEGVILDRGFATKDVFDLITSRGLKYIAMLKSDCTGFSTMFAKHSNDIHWELRTGVADNLVFGITDTVPVFAGSEPSCVALFFNGENATTSGRKLMTIVRCAMRDIQNKIAEGDNNITVPAKANPYIELVHGEDGNIIDAKYNFDEWQKTFDGYGYHAIASSHPYSPEEIYQLYQHRDKVEKFFSSAKSQTGFKRIRCYTDQGIKNKIGCMFIAGIIRWQIFTVCKEMRKDTNTMIKSVNSAVLRYMPGDRYEEIYNLSSIVKKFLGKFDIQEEHFKLFAMEINQQRKTTILSPVRVIPELNPSPKKSENSKKVKNNDTVSKKKIVNKLKKSKIKKKLKKEKLEHKQATAAGELQPRRKPGRPKGSKNKKTLEKERLEQEQLKHKRGRPKGSKNKKTLEKERQAQEQHQPKRGRPKGSKNKKTLERERQLALQEQQPQVQQPQVQQPQVQQPQVQQAQVQQPQVQQPQVQQPQVQQPQVQQPQVQQPQVQQPQVQQPQVQQPQVQQPQVQQPQVQQPQVQQPQVQQPQVQQPQVQQPQVQQPQEQQPQVQQPQVQQPQVQQPQEQRPQVKQPQVPQAFQGEEARTELLGNLRFLKRE